MNKRLTPFAYALKAAAPPRVVAPTTRPARGDISEGSLEVRAFRFSGDLTGLPEDEVFYAGHAYIHPGSSVGYWIPTDANVDDPRGWLSNIDIARFMANIPARQQLLVSDSCFSGSLTRERVAEEQRTGLNRNAILMRRSVVAMSSGGEEVVADSTLAGHSPFTYYLLHQLQEAKGEIPARDMLLSIRDKVTNNAGQVPSYGIIISSGHASGGEYLLNPKTN